MLVLRQKKDDVLVTSKIVIATYYNKEYGRGILKLLNSK